MYIYACGNNFFSCFLFFYFSNDAEDQYVWHILVHFCDFEFWSSIRIACFVLLFVTCVYHFKSCSSVKRIVQVAKSPPGRGGSDSN